MIETSGFRVFLRKEEESDVTRNMIDGSNLILFFKKGDAVFGAPEESRITLAKLKNPDDEDAGLYQDASFLGINLIDAISGKTTQNLFGKKDLSAIKIIDRSECEKLLAQHKKKPKQAIIRKNLGSMQGDDDGLMHITDDE